MKKSSSKNSRPIPVKRPVYTSKDPRRQRNTSPWFIVVGVVFILICLSTGIIFVRNGSRTNGVTPTNSITFETTASSTPTALLSPTAKFILMPDIPSLQLMILELINQDRRAEGLDPLELDQTAATVGVVQAQEMAKYGYLSYWNLDGLGPDLRFFSNGGVESITERSYRKQIVSEILPTIPNDWDALVRNIYAEYSQSPSFREAILNPAFTHSGIGVAYDNSTGWFVVTQEFVGKYISIATLPRTVSLGTEIDLVGTINYPDIQSVSIELKYEPIPNRRTLADLNSISDFVSIAETFQSFDLSVAQGQFGEKILMDYLGQKGYYHIYVWINTPKTGRFLVVDYIIQVV